MLACTPSLAASGVVGPVIAAVGLVGVGDIATDGYCTITMPYYLNPDHASFCGTLNLIGNVATLTNLYGNGARKYQVSHRYGATAAAAAAAPTSLILQSWANFEIVRSQRCLAILRPGRERLLSDGRAHPSLHHSESALPVDDIGGA